MRSRGVPWIGIECPERYRRPCSDVLGAIEALGATRLAKAAARAAALHSRRTRPHV
jgi:hypothetical protein